LARLISEPLRAEQLPALGQFGELQAAASSLPHQGEELDEELSAALHQEFFGFNVLPFAGVYLNPDGSIGGSVTSDLIDILRPIGLGHDPRGESPEHLGRMLQLLGALQGEAFAQTGARAEALDGAIAQLLDRCLLPWLPAVVQSLQSMGQPFYYALAQQIWRQTLAHRAELGAYQTQPVELEPDLLENPKTGLRQIADYLASPCRCGLNVDAAMITRASRFAGIPRGFGGRSQMLETLLFSAADQHALPQVVAGLLEGFEASQSGFEQLAGQGLLESQIVKPWLQRLQASKQLLTRLAQAAQRP
jgi:TorA maturation chaperone TorD